MKNMRENYKMGDEMDFSLLSSRKYSLENAKSVSSIKPAKPKTKTSLNLNLLPPKSKEYRSIYLLSKFYQYLGILLTPTSNNSISSTYNKSIPKPKPLSSTYSTISQNDERNKSINEYGISQYLRNE